MSSFQKKALIVFTDDNNLFFLRFLRKGFRHCFLMLHDGDNWISVDPLFSQLIINAEKNIQDSEKLIAWFKSLGYQVISSEISKTMHFSFLGFYSCVGVVKKILGVRNPFILTPYQLFKHISKHNSKEEKKNG